MLNWKRLAVLIATAGAFIRPVPATAGDIVETALQAGQFNTLAQALQAAGLVDALKEPGPFTVFAPTDEAFARLPEGTLEDLLKPENRDRLRNVLTYHVVSGKVTSSQVVKLREATALNGQKIRISVRGSEVRVNDARVVKPDVEASNGVIHVIDRVILPPQ